MEKPVIGINSLPRNWQAGKSLSNGLAPPGFARGTVSQRYEVSPPQVGRWSPDAFGSLFRLSISSSSRLRDRRPEPVLALCRASQCSCRRYADVGGMHQAGGLVIVSIAGKASPCRCASVSPTCRPIAGRRARAPNSRPPGGVTARVANCWTRAFGRGASNGANSSEIASPVDPDRCPPERSTKETRGHSSPSSPANPPAPEVHKP